MLLEAAACSDFCRFAAYYYFLLSFRFSQRYADRNIEMMLFRACAATPGASSALILDMPPRPSFRAMPLPPPPRQSASFDAPPLIIFD